MNPIAMQAVARQRQSDTLKAAAQRRRVRQARADRPGVIARLRMQLGRRAERQHFVPGPGPLGWAEE